MLAQETNNNVEFVEDEDDEVDQSQYDGTYY